VLGNTHGEARLLQQWPQLRQRLHRGEGHHHHTAGPQTIQHGLQQLSAIAAATAHYHPIRIRQSSQGFWSTALQHPGWLHTQPLAVGTDQGR